ncbi:5-oxoprolinase subunit PxpA [Maribacter sp. 2210JD10-5]|uniref:5-oxoprolinase subunit PxpA n=1 Tax=Maribacter sp. 2210JD10-5 TaxID=3386272 RepID=UPI0039BD6266
MEKYYIDLNCDVGEGIGHEAQLFPLISSCNIACGGHAGDASTMHMVVRLAKKHQLKIGAHPSYPDKENFGRISMDIGDTDLLESIQEQIELLRSISKKENIDLYHIKPHGALYNDVAKSEKLASLFLKAIEKYKKELFLYVPYASVIEKLAFVKGYKIKREAFADRNYNDDLTLVSRREENALITEPSLVLKHVVNMVTHNLVKTVSLKKKAIKADTYCIHGDTPSALQILTYLSKELPNYNCFVKK